MDFSSILQNVRKHILLNPEEEGYFISLLSQRQLGKKEILLKAGDPCGQFSYVSDGLLRAYYTDRQDNESIIMFAIKDWWITDMYAFVNEKPALLNIGALEDSTLLQLDKKDMDLLCQKVPKFERCFRMMIQNAYVREQLRTIENLTAPAEERYHNFLLKYPQFASRIPLKQIASYLGVTPEFLSVVRKRRK